MGTDGGCGHLRRGFSLLELVIAMAITLIVGLAVFQLFIQNQSVFRDQNLVLEMQQSARAVASMIADELRMAGQGVPAYASKVNASVDEATQTFLNTSNATTIIFRADMRNGTAKVQTGSPLTYAIGSPVTIQVDDAGPIGAIVGANTDRFLYLWGPYEDAWTWVRAQIDDVDTALDEIDVTPAQIAGWGGTFGAVPNISVEQAIAYRINGSDIQRGSSGSFLTMTPPALTYSTVGENFTGLTFTYYDASDTVITLGTLADRARVARVDFTLVARTAEELPSTGDFDSYAISMTVYPRNVAIY